MGGLSAIRLAAALLILISGAARAGELEFSGSVGLEARKFFEDPQFTGQFEHFQFSGILEPELRWESDDRAHQLVVAPFVRVDSQDDEHTHFDLREAYWRYTADQWELLIGATKVFWGVTESRHLVNIVNQSDTLEDIDEEDKLGQPMAKVTLFTDWGDISVFALPYFRERTFVGPDSRLRTPLAVDAEAALYESSLRRHYPDFAVRYSNYFGDWDVGLSVFHGTSREPTIGGVTPEGLFIPFYNIITQVGADVQYTTGPWLWKFEGIVREGQGRTFVATAVGFEYTLYQIFESNMDLGLLMEYLGDTRDSMAPVTLFDNDLFMGSRLALNDAQDTSALVGAVVDLNNGSTSFRIEAERRIGDSLKLEVEGQIFAHAATFDPLQAFRKDSFATLRLSYFY